MLGIGHGRLVVCSTTYHQFLAHDCLGETRVVFDLSGGGELATGSGAIGHEAFIQNSYSPTSVNSSASCAFLSHCGTGRAQHLRFNSALDR